MPRQDPETLKPTGTVWGHKVEYNIQLPARGSLAFVNLVDDAREYDPQGFDMMDLRLQEAADQHIEQRIEILEEYLAQFVIVRHQNGGSYENYVTVTDENTYKSED